MELDPDLISALRTVDDPELGIDVVSLGLVYEARRVGDQAHVVMTMTTPACPLGEVIIGDAVVALETRVPGVRHADVELVFDPPWSPERMSPEAKEHLNS